jgi:RNA polymerase sigma-70 factor (ECF subfamily)
MPPPAEPQVPSDQELVAAYRGGEERAATFLVQRHAPSVARFLYSTGADREELDDLVQETLFRAFRRLDSWRGESGFRSWIFSIAGNLFRDERRKRRGRTVVPLLDSDLPVAPAPDEEHAAEEAGERIREMLARLPRLQREVFVRRVQGGEGYDAIASALGTTPGAARVHFHHAVKRLKESVR